MSESEKKQRRQRRSFGPEFKAEAVKLVLEEGKSVAEVARDLDLTETAFRRWVEQARSDRGRGKPGALTVGDLHVPPAGRFPLCLLRLGEEARVAA